MSAAEKLRKMLDKAAEQLRLGYACYWTRRELGKELENRQAVFDIAPGFFFLALNALRDSAILYLTILFDKGKHKFTVDRIRECVESNEASFFPRATAQQIRKTILPSFKQSVKEIRKQADAMVEVRKQQIAHLNSQMVLQGRQVSIDDIEKVYRKTHEALDDLAKACFGTENGIEMLEIQGIADFGGLLEMAEFGTKEVARLALR